MNAAESVTVSANERSVALILLGAATLLRLPYIIHYRFNSDEPQHLHVVWGWVRGLLPYRDVFDNHPPLFHALMAPFLALVGERPDALIWMRCVMVPLALAATWLTYVIAANAFGRRAALWSAVLLGLHYEFFFLSIEFRTDNLWTVGWLAALAVITGGPITGRRALVAGAALGATLCVSQKTVMLVAALAGAAVVVVLSENTERAAQWLRAGRLTVTAATGLVAVPLAVSIYFAARGAWGALVYGVFTHNTVSDLGTWDERWRLAILVAGMVPLAWLASARIRAAAGDRTRRRRVFLALVTAIYTLLLESVWPLITGQDLLPLMPLAAILIVAALESWEGHLRRRTQAGAVARTAPAVVLLLVLLAETGVVVLKGPIWRDRGSGQTALVAEVLALTDRDDPVVDTKGETIFRRRAFFGVLETITIERLRRGLLQDTIAQDVVRNRCFVATMDSARFPGEGRAFLNRNFISVGALRVAGKLLPASDGPGRQANFEIAVPGPYAVVTARGAAAGTLDGTTYAGARVLAAGSHEFAPDHAEGRLAVVWARAIERGYSPFARPRDES